MKSLEAAKMTFGNVNSLKVIGAAACSPGQVPDTYWALMTDQYCFNYFSG
jgi:hypothetical protein